MPDIPSEESSAHYILTILLSHRWTDRHVLSALNFTLPFAKLGWNSKDLKRGIRYAIQHGWVAVSTPASFTLTDVGFAKASAIAAEKIKQPIADGADTQIKSAPAAGNAGLESQTFPVQ